MELIVRGASLQISTATNYGTAPSGAPSVDASVLGGGDATSARRAYLAMTADGACKLGGGGTVWLCRHSVSQNVWRKCARLAGGGSISLTATLGWEEPLDEVLADSDGFAVYDEGGGALGATVTVVMGFLG